MNVNKIATYTGHRDCVYVLEKAGEANRFFSAAGDGMVVRWDFETPDQGELIAKVDNSVYAMAFVPEKDWLIIGQNFKGLHVIDLKTKQEIRNLHFTEAAIFDILVANNQVFVASGDGKVYVFELENLSLLNVLAFSTQSARTLAYNPTNKHLAIGYSDHSIRIVAHDVLIKTIELHTNSVFAVTYSPDGTELLSGGRDAHLKVWDVENNYAEKVSIVAHMYAINDIVFSPNNLFYATGSMDKSIKIWDSKTHKLLKVIDKSRHAGHGTSVNKLFWSNYDNLLVSASDDRSISVWKIGFGD